MMVLQDRYSLWPDFRLPWPQVRVGPCKWVDGGWLVPADDGVRGEAITAPRDLHLREFADTNPRDLDSLKALCETVGLPLNPAYPTHGINSYMGTDQGSESRYRMRYQ